ncbi:MAG: sodium:proton antiporter [Planctomycetes bacterium]|nr:sodium:proton antiporter [Planctomycetota bacterium]
MIKLRHIASGLIMLLGIAGLTWASGESSSEVGKHLPLWSVIPFALMLLSIAIIPLAFAHWWESNLHKGIISLILGIPVAIYILKVHAPELGVVALDYVSFIILLGALYVIAGGIYIKGSLAGTPLINTVVLAIGAVLASFIGTTGASMLLIRPLIRANKARRAKAHIIIFFIFIVSNCGGLLTPLGDPPLFLGFLKGVPFLWTFNLVWEWLFVCGILLVAFNIYDQWKFHKEDIATPGDLDQQVEPKKALGMEGTLNFLFLGGVVAAIFLSGYLNWEFGIKEALMMLMAVCSLLFTRKHTRQSNGFTFGPIIEVAVLFAGIFVTMIPALMILNARGTELGLTQPWHFFWATGSLSSFLDNAPTYLTMTSAASGILNVPLSAMYLKDLLAVGGQGVFLLTAISCGAVFMGANTYIGNGPNFMVKAIAEESKIKMPSFFGYMAYSILILIPIFILVTFIFFRG